MQFHVRSSGQQNDNGFFVVAVVGKANVQPVWITRHKKQQAAKKLHAVFRQKIGKRHAQCPFIVRQIHSDGTHNKHHPELRIQRRKMIGAAFTIDFQQKSEKHTNGTLTHKWWRLKMKKNRTNFSNMRFVYLRIFFRLFSFSFWDLLHVSHSRKSSFVHDLFCKCDGGPFLCTAVAPIMQIGTRVDTLDIDRIASADRTIKNI